MSGTCAVKAVRTSNESHVETLIYLFAKIRRSFSLCANGKLENSRDVSMLVWNSRKCRNIFFQHLQFFGCCRSIQSIPGTYACKSSGHWELFLWCDLIKRTFFRLGIAASVSKSEIYAGKIQSVKHSRQNSSKTPTK